MWQGIVEPSQRGGSELECRWLDQSRISWRRQRPESAGRHDRRRSGNEVAPFQLLQLIALHLSIPCLPAGSELQDMELVETRARSAAHKPSRNRLADPVQMRRAGSVTLADHQCFRSAAPA